MSQVSNNAEEDRPITKLRRVKSKELLLVRCSSRSTRLQHIRIRAQSADAAKEVRISSLLQENNLMRNYIEKIHNDPIQSGLDYAPMVVDDGPASYFLHETLETHMIASAPWGDQLNLSQLQQQQTIIEGQADELKKTKEGIEMLSQQIQELKIGQNMFKKEVPLPANDMDPQPPRPPSSQQPASNMDPQPLLPPPSHPLPANNSLPTSTPLFRPKFDLSNPSGVTAAVSTLMALLQAMGTVGGDQWRKHMEGSSFQHSDVKHSQESQMSSDEVSDWRRLIRHIWRWAYGTEKHADFSTYQPASPAIIDSYKRGIGPGPGDDLVLDFGHGWGQSTWNKVVLKKLLEHAHLEQREKGLADVSDNYINAILWGYLKQAQESYAKWEQGKEAEEIHGTSGHCKTCYTGENQYWSCGPFYLDLFQRYFGVIGEDSSTTATVKGIWQEIFMVKLCEWRAKEVDGYLSTIDQKGSEAKLPGPGPKKALRVPTTEIGEYPAVPNLPHCLYDAKWLSEWSWVKLNQLQVSEEAFHLLMVATEHQVRLMYNPATSLILDKISHWGELFSAKLRWIVMPGAVELWHYTSTGDLSLHSIHLFPSSKNLSCNPMTSFTFSHQCPGERIDTFFEHRGQHNAALESAETSQDKDAHRNREISARHQAPDSYTNARIYVWERVNGFHVRHEWDLCLDFDSSDYVTDSESDSEGDVVDGGQEIVIIEDDNQLPDHNEGVYSFTADLHRIHVPVIATSVNDSVQYSSLEEMVYLCYGFIPPTLTLDDRSPVPDWFEVQKFAGTSYSSIGRTSKQTQDTICQFFGYLESIPKDMYDLLQEDSDVHR
ncbi:hypothetical protein ARMGADRAFT_1037770 [Armillaria gallica]|uniref:Uncharacterized protein n=1 Tax=Armillaria gallica TaxID=47427 RepID=A0A2H3D3I4_ARMGA|nr:hypothetical protein ARMGADRAFT_1037770 [Armillaria gallica]